MTRTTHYLSTFYLPQIPQIFADIQETRLVNHSESFIPLICANRRNLRRISVNVSSFSLWLDFNVFRFFTTQAQSVAAEFEFERIADIERVDRACQHRLDARGGIVLHEQNARRRTALTCAVKS